MLYLLHALAAAIAPPLDVVTAQRLAVNLQPSEQKELSGLSVSAAAAMLRDHGVVHLKGALPLDVVDGCAEAVTASFERCCDELKERKIRQLDAFAFAELAHRSKLRFDMQLATSATALPDALMASPPWTPLLHKILGDDCIDLFQGAVIAQPGAADQQPHMDGGHLYQGTHGYEQAQNPAHCINAFVPLVDVTEESGPTEFWPGSHVLERAQAAFAGASPSVSLAGQRGDVILFDYRVVHRGRGNVGESSRPVLYLTYARSWFRDAQNFPDERLLPDAGSTAASGAAGGFGKSKAKGGAPTSKAAKSKAKNKRK